MDVLQGTVGGEGCCLLLVTVWHLYSVNDLLVVCCRRCVVDVCVSCGRSIDDT
jgi:hypothetical protein